MEIPLTLEDCNFVLESLEYTRKAFQETGIAPHGTYPSYEFKQERMSEVEGVIKRVRKLRNQLKEA